ncbi:hypothetical protein F0562_003768 [Nyssa sinensis]|uniref:Uncharacterized protein n=1 Tax=Nyssa sinensis TaxID=561372 RepID=A0A5J5BWX3_9ASTE|nr:hypothetical protein F0562_003768 [Nyssa sinensis]
MFFGYRRRFHGPLTLIHGLQVPINLMEITFEDHSFSRLLRRRRIPLQDDSKMEKNRNRTRLTGWLGYLRRFQGTKVTELYEFDEHNQGGFIPVLDIGKHRWFQIVLDSDYEGLGVFDTVVTGDD